MKSLYNELYFKTRYIDPFYMSFKISNIYYLWIAYFCLIRPANLKKGSKVLDVGCGIGNLVWALRTLGIDAYGVDPSISANKFCRIPEFCIYKFYKKLPYKDSSFDLVYTNEVLEHIEEKKLDGSINEMGRVSKNMMIHIIGVEERGSMITDDPTHFTIKIEKWWEAKFKKLGLKVRKGNFFYFFPFIFSRKVKITGVKKGYFIVKKNNE